MEVVSRREFVSTHCNTMLYTIIAVGMLGSGAGELPRPFAIEVVDRETGRGVPLIELRTVNEIRLFTDSNGLVAFDEPGLMGEKVFFNVSGHGYEYPKDGFGMRGRAIEVTPGGHARLEVQRVNVAERLYRVTGGGIYADTIRLGREAPTAHPVLNGKVFGQDSVLSVVRGDTIRWFWGDTGRPSYPLGNFHMSGATSKLPGAGGLDPDVGVDLTYLVDENGFSRPTCEMPGAGPTWASGLSIVADKSGKSVIQAGYVKIRNMLEAYEHGLVRFDEAKEEFEQVVVFPEGRPIYPEGHPIQWGETEGDWVQFASPYPWTRVPATAEAMADLERYEGFTCLVEGTTAKDGQIDRDESGKVRYAWKRATAPLSLKDQTELEKEGKLKPGEGLHVLRDVETGKVVRAHGATVYWNAYRGRWVMIVVEVYGSASMLGEVWYAEAEAPEGPWVYARKVATHDQYSFYNPKQHPYFAKDGGRTIYFEGTYTFTFSGNKGMSTPRYDYNQMMYRLNLDDPRVNLPVGVWSGGDPAEVPPDFYAMERPAEGAVPLELPGAHRVAQDAQPPRLYGYAPESKEAPEATIGLFREARKDGALRYRTAEQPVEEGWTRDAKPMAKVWPNPLRVAIAPRSSP